jgi:multiple sugar transport system permease protein
MVKVNKKKIIRYSICLLFAILFLIPFVFIIVNSMMSGAEIVDRYTHQITPTNSWDLTMGDVHFVNPSIFPNHVTLKQYTSFLLESTIYLRMLWNTIFLSVPSVFGNLSISILGAYAFRQMKWKHKEKLYALYIMVMLLPAQVSLISHFLMIDFLGITNSYVAVMLPALFNPFGVFLVRQMSDSFLDEYSESASIDGAGHFRIMKDIFIPIMKPVLALLGLLLFIENWNSVERPLVFIKEMVELPLSVYLSSAINAHLGQVFAVCVAYMLPVLLAFHSVKDELKQTVSYEGVK